jgi:hypothetical protein
MSRELGRVADLPELTTLPLYVLFALEVGDRYLQIWACRAGVACGRPLRYRRRLPTRPTLAYRRNGSSLDDEHDHDTREAR